MDSPTNKRDPERVAELLVRLAPVGGAAVPCPDAERIAALAEGRLSSDERETVLAHTAACEACRSIVAALVTDVRPTAGAAERREPGRIVFRFSLLAAAVILALLAGVLARSSLQPAAASTREGLFAWAEELERTRPELFAGFAPFAAGDAAAPRLRGGPILLHPAPPPAKVLDARPAFRWEAVAGAEYAVELWTDDGRMLWRADSAEPRLDYPAEEAALEPGSRYLWSVAARGPVESEGASAFDVAPSAELLAFEQSIDHVAANAPAELADLLGAHLALDRGYLFEAERAARRFHARHPEDETARATLALVLERLGATERVP